MRIKREESKEPSKNMVEPSPHVDLWRGKRSLRGDEWETFQLGFSNFSPLKDLHFNKKGRISMKHANNHKGGVKIKGQRKSLSVEGNKGSATDGCREDDGRLK